VISERILTDMHGKVTLGNESAIISYP